MTLRSIATPVLLALTLALDAPASSPIPQAGRGGQGPEILVTGGGATAVDSAKYAAQAAEAWAAVVDRSDPRALDAFTRAWPDSDPAVDAFTLRFEHVRASQSIAQYQDFILAHPRRLGTQLAIAELFDLYRGEDRLSGYIDFLARYPNTAEAVVARAHAEQLAFTFATKVGTVEAYDGFLAAFPDAPQAESAASLARRRALEDHRAAYERAAASRDEDETERWVNRRLRSMRFDYRDLWTAISTEQPTPQVYEFLERSVLGRRPSEITDELRLGLARRMERIYYVVRWFEPYQTAEASDTIVAEARHQELIAKLEEIRLTLEERHDALVLSLQQEMRATRDVLRNGFDELIREHRLDRKAMEAGFGRLENSMAVLHEDLGAIYGELRSIHSTLSDVAVGIQETNVRLGRLDERLAGMHQSLVSMHRDMNRGFDGVQQSVRRLNRDLNRGFDRQYAIASAQLEVATQSLEVQAETLGAIHHGFERLDGTMRAGFTRLEDATWGAASMVAESNQALAESLRAPEPAQGGGGFFQTALGKAGEFVPGVGPILGTVAGEVVGRVVDKAIAGEEIDVLDLGKTAVTAGVGKKFGGQYPAAAGIAGKVYDTAIIERRESYARAGQALGQFGAEAVEDVPWRSMLRSATTPADFSGVAEELGRAAGLPDEAVQYAALRIF